MTRTAKPTDFTVPVEGVGTFTFGRRTMRDEVAIQVAYARIIDGVIPTAWLEAVGGWISVLGVMVARAPDGWDVDSLDPTDPETYAKLRIVYEALSVREASFRRRPGVSGEAVGEGAAGLDRV